MDGVGVKVQWRIRWEVWVGRAEVVGMLMGEDLADMWQDQEGLSDSAVFE